MRSGKEEHKVGIYITEVSPDQYGETFHKTLVFSELWFNEMNKGKVEEIKYLIFSDSHKRFGLCVGKRKDEWLCPFSAPFGLIEAVKLPIKLELLEEAVDELDIYLQSQHCSVFRWVLPPLFYQETMITMLQNILLRKKFRILSMDINFHFRLKGMHQEKLYRSIPRNGRKNLKISLQSGLEFTKCDTMDGIERAYGVIYENRRCKGYPLKMSFEEVCSTIRFMRHDFFLVSRNEENIASAMVFYVTDKIAQVIYWGDKPGHSELKPINFLSFQLIQFYQRKGMDYLDIGPSSENGYPNYGLCSFKSSIGCECSPKLTVEKNFF